MIGVVIKGRLSLNELRYKQCFQLRATKFSHPVKDFDPLYLSLKTASVEIGSETTSPQIEEYYWLKNDLTIKDWIHFVECNREARQNEMDYWK